MSPKHSDSWLNSDCFQFTILLCPPKILQQPTSDFIDRRTTFLHPEPLNISWMKDFELFLSVFSGLNLEIMHVFVVFTLWMHFFFTSALVFDHLISTKFVWIRRLRTVMSFCSCCTFLQADFSSKNVGDWWKIHTETISVPQMVQQQLPVYSGLDWDTSFG